MKRGSLPNRSNLNQDQTDFYNENGYLVISDLVTVEECDNLQKHIRRHSDKDYGAIVNIDREEYLAERDPRDKTPMVWSEILETSKLCQNIMKDPRTVSILETLLDKEVVGLSSQVLFKEAHSPYASQAWEPHQDNNYIQNQNGMYITTNLFLESADVENGTVYIYPGSHKLGLLNADQRISYREKKGTNPGNKVEIPEEFKNKKEDILLEKGSTLILNGNTIHGSYPNNSNRSRPWFSCCYIAKGEFFNMGKNARRYPINLH